MISCWAIATEINVEVRASVYIIRIIQVSSLVLHDLLDFVIFINL